MVSIIVLSYNTKDLLEKCLHSLLSVLKGFDYEIIVVDNASKDKTVQMVKEKFPNILLIKNTKNVGFSRGNNIGAKHAKGDYLLFLNSDTKVLDNGIKDMAAFLKSRKEVGIVGGLLQNIDGSLQRSYGSYYNLFNVFFMLFGREKAELVRYSHTALLLVDWVSGGFMMVRKKLFKKLGGFDEGFFMYIEDVELCLRARKEGLKIYFFPDAKVLHMAQGSSDRAFAIHYIYKGLLHLYKKHSNSFQYGIVKGLLMIKAIFAIMFGILTNNVKLTRTYKNALKYSL